MFRPSEDIAEELSGKYIAKQQIYRRAGEKYIAKQQALQRNGGITENLHRTAVYMLAETMNVTV